ncbi:MAG: amino acid ABC transporter permease [Bifidobacteriaceae bacterium]|jgi:polar amino acid transport system permease protein|nr:amino acid ABC transporter permease [Bifidobacteriaceae bacterium]
MDFNYINAHSYQFVDAGLLVIKLGFIGIIGALLLGKIVAMSRYFKVPLLSQIGTIYTEISRNTPLLILLFFLYYGFPKVGIMLSSEASAIIGLVFMGGGYMCESFMSGYRAVDKGQMEAGRSLGLNGFSVFRLITFPQSLKYCFASIGANFIFILKETSVLSVVALLDITNVAKDLIGMHYNTSEAMFMLVVSYLIILVPIAIALALIEKFVISNGQD